MVRFAGVGLMALLLPVLAVQHETPARVADGAAYTSDGQLRYPEEYREWVFLTSGMDMSYDPKPIGTGMGMFDNVFVNPEAYRRYQKTGHWPDGTVLVLENRGAETGTSINKAGKTQTHEVMGMEVHVLDPAHNDPQLKNDGWAFYDFDNKGSGKLIPRPASCYSCHEQHAAVDTTFVQFYPTLVEAAQKHGTYSAAYLREVSGKK